MWNDLGHVNKLQRSIFTTATAARCVYAVPLDLGALLLPLPLGVFTA